MSDIDPLDLLRAANPSPERSTPEPQLSVDALFEQITMNTIDVEIDQPNHLSIDTDAASVGSRSARSSRRWRPRVAMSAAAAVAALVVGGAVLLDPGSTPSASALVAEAAATSADFESGRVAVTIDMVEVPDDEATGSIVLDYRFDDGDFALSFDTSLLDDETNDPDLEEVGNIDIRGVGDKMFSSDEEGASFFSMPRSEEAESVQALFGLQPTSMEPATVVALLQQTDDFEAVTTEDGTVSYQGSVATDTLEELGPDSLPAGLSLLADQDTPNDDLPEMLGIDVVVVDGLLDTVTIDIDGESELGYTKGSITTTFSEYGEPQNIEAPPAEQISDELAPFPGGIPGGLEDSLAVLDELESRRPGLCSEFYGDFETVGNVVEEDIAQQIEALLMCFEDAGEQAAAEAFRSLNSFGD